MRLVSVPLMLALCAAVIAGAPAPALSAQAAADTQKAAAPVINLNTAAPSQLEGLPGVGPKVAARIVEYRQKNGGFKKVEELMNVRGIGEKLFLRLKSRLTVAAAKADQQ